MIINFNYTNYWEKLYKNKASVYYPHGNIVEGQPKIGYTLHKTTNKNFEGEYSPERIDYKEILNEFNKRDWDFYKNIKKMINYDFLEIYSYGFSFGEQDWIYFNELSKKTNTIIIKIFEYNKEQQKTVKDSIEKMIIKNKIKNINYKFISSDFWI